ncbi:trace amine-associated receptor 7a-like [Betta splendens]|uniref:Trace amine-associated receptor 7a-like n=1 Tax=Betta splendens TaxID=158456 RepID=A0A9W2XXN1_BETSP|nr:trace amine-associated receptor 7a-like [Betta splendens]
METLEDPELCFPHLLNASCRKNARPHTEAMLIYVLVPCIALLTASLNLLVIVSISHFRQLHTSTNLLLLSLAVSDFLVGLIVMPFQILFLEPCWFLGDLVCTFYFFVPYIAINSSVINIVLISVDRYVAICHPLSYATKFSQKTVKLCVLLCWLYCVMYSFMILNDNLKQPGRFNSCYGQCVINVNGGVDMVLNFIIPISAIIVLYVRVFVVAVSQARSMRSHVAAVKLQRSLTVTVRKSEIKAAKTLGVTVFVFLMCFVPYYCASLSGYILTINTSTNDFIHFLVLSNSCLNPLIYTFLYPWFRKSVKLILTLQILQPNSRETCVK